MTYDIRTLDGTSGATITAGNSGFQSVNTAGSGGTATYTTTNAVHGQAGTFTTGSSPSNGNFARLAYAGGGATSVSTSFIHHFDTPTPGTGYQIFSVRTSVGRAYSLALQTTGILQGADSVNALTNFITAAQITANPTMRIVLIVSNPSTTAGVVTMKAYTTSGTQIGSTVNLTNANLGSGTTFTLSDVGVLTTAASVSSTFDDVQTNDGTTTEIGAYSPPANVPPTITVGGPYTATVGVPQTVVATGADSDGTVASYTWSFAEYPPALGSAPTISNATSASASFTPTVTGRYILNVYCTDNSGANSTTSQVFVYVPGTTIYPVATTSNTSWTLAAIGNLTDSNDATYAESAASGSNAQLVLRLAPLISTGTGFSLDIRNYVTATGGTQSVQLLEGATVRKDWGAITPGTTAGDTILTLTPTEISTIGNWNALDLRFTQV